MLCLSVGCEQSAEDMNDRKNTLSAISLFSGAGGMDLGFERAGFDVHWSMILMAQRVKPIRQISIVRMSLVQ